MILFYQLDIQKGETTQVCLGNLIMSLVLKNPVYTRIMDLIKTVYKVKVKQIELEIDSIIKGESKSDST